MTKEETRERFRALRVCVIVPNYDNGGTVTSIARLAAEYCETVIVVDDGSTDNSLEKLEQACQECYAIRVHAYTPNRGKGHALLQGFRLAMNLGFRYAISLDADGQHFADDLPLFAEALTHNADALLVGSRRFDDPNMPSCNFFANRFSNFWFAVQTGRLLPDTQTGYRAYPLHKMGNIHLCTPRYEAELELLVRCAWRGIKLVPLPIRVYYPPQEKRISHFRPCIDFLRISLLNTVLCFVAIFYGYPAMLFHRLFKKEK